MDAHKVSSAISPIRTTELASFMGAFIQVFLLYGWMCPFTTKVLEMFLQSLLLEKDLVTELTLVLSSLVVLIQVHTEG